MAQKESKMMKSRGRDENIMKGGSTNKSDNGRGDEKR